MTVSTLRMELRLEPGLAPREKRRRMQAIMEKLHKHFNVALAEADGPAGPDDAVLLVATVARARRDARETLERVADAVSAHPKLAVLGHAIHEV